MMELSFFLVTFLALHQIFAWKLVSAVSRRVLVQELNGIKKTLREDFPEQFDKIKPELNTLKREITDTNSRVQGVQRKTQMRDMLVGVRLALPKFKTGDPLQITSGISDILFGATFYFGNPVWGLAAGVISSILSQFVDSSSMSDALLKMVQHAIKEEIDHLLKGEAEGVINKFKEYQTTFGSYKNKKESELTDEDFQHVDLNMNLYDDNIYLSKLRHRLMRGGSNHNDAQKCVTFSLLYYEMCKIRDLMYLEKTTFLSKSENYKNVVNGLELRKQGALDYYGKSLKFLHSQGGYPTTNKDKVLDFSQLMCVTYFLPYEKNLKHFELHKFLGKVGVPGPPTIISESGAKYYIREKRWPDYLVEGCRAFSSNYKSKRRVHVALNILKRSDGYYNVYCREEVNCACNLWCFCCECETKTFYMGVSSQKSSQSAFGLQWGDSANAKLIFTPRNARGDTFLISTQKYPDRYFYIRKDGSLFTHQGDPGSAGYFFVENI